jgi:hypothetical protein
MTLGIYAGDFGYADDRLGGVSDLTEAEQARARQRVEEYARDDEDLAELLATLDLIVSAA